MHISLHSPYISHYMIPFLYLIAISFLHLITLKPHSHYILHILKIYILSRPSFMHLIILPLLYVTSSLLFLSPISFQPWRMPILQDTSSDSSLNCFTYSPHYRFLTYMSYYIELFMNLIKIPEGTYLIVLFYLMHPVTTSQLHISLKYFFSLFNMSL